MIADAGQVAHTAAANQHDRVLLKVMAFAWDVADHFALVGETHLGDLAKRRVRLLRGRGVDARAHATDRKSVGEGKSVSVRGDLGGRLVIKQKQKDQTKRD